MEYLDAAVTGSHEEGLRDDCAKWNRQAGLGGDYLRGIGSRKKMNREIRIYYQGYYFKVEW